MALAMEFADEAREGHTRGRTRHGLAFAAFTPFGPRAGVADPTHLLRRPGDRPRGGCPDGRALRIGRGMHVDGTGPRWVPLPPPHPAGLDQAGIVTAINIAARQLPTSLHRPIGTGDTARNTPIWATGRCW